MAAQWQTMKTLDDVTYYMLAGVGTLRLDLPLSATDGGMGEWCWAEDAVEGWVAMPKARCPAGKKALPLSHINLDRPVVDDLVMLDEITEGLICHTLRKRYEADSFCANQFDTGDLCS